jgi:hypothetical protein
MSTTNLPTSPGSKEPPSPGEEPLEQTDGRTESAAPSSPSPQGEAVDAKVVSPPDTLHHWLLMIGAAIVVLLAALLEVRDTEKIALPGIESPLPGVCTFRRVTGQPCPGCGLTRSFVSIAHGDLGGAWFFNAAGPLIFLLVAGQVPYRAWRLWQIRRGVEPGRGSQLFNHLLWVMVAVLMGQWLVRMLPFF